MAERPASSFDFLAQYNDLLRQIREMRSLIIDDADFPVLQTFEDGQPLGDTRFLDFGANIRATLTADGFVRVSADEGGLLGWDAIVDSTFTATNENARQFLGIGEALAYLLSIGLTRAFVLVRPGTYTETANWTAPAFVHLMAAAGTSQASGTTRWQPAGFSCTTSGVTYTTQGIDFLPQTTTPNNFLGAGTSILYAKDCVFNHVAGSTPGATFTYATEVYLADCVVQKMRPMASSILMWVGGEYVDNSGSAVNITLGNRVIIRDVAFLGGAGGPTNTWTITSYFDVQISTPASGFNATDALVSLQWTASTAGRIRAKVASEDTYAISVTTPASGLSAYLEGAFGNLSLGSLIAGEPPHYADADLSGTCDIATTIFVLRRNSGVATGFTFRGGCQGFIHTRGPIPSSGTYLSFVASTHSTVFVSAAATTPTGTAKPFDFDGSSNNNTVIMPNTNSWPVAGTGAGGTNENYVLPEDGAAMAGGGVAGHVIEDEGTPLTQRADLNFVGAGVTAADSGGKTVVTIPGGGGSEPSVMDWMF